MRLEGPLFNGKAAFPEGAAELSCQKLQGPAPLYADPPHSSEVSEAFQRDRKGRKARSVKAVSEQRNTIGFSNKSEREM